ncbi:MAG: CPBP family intramembrane metalloprotease [Lachnospiraceae bacterium]|nr:CPBP family intramembrane metalloprotease [Lachnospiraceae bacterium]
MNKSANRLFLLIVALFIGASLSLRFLIPDAVLLKLPMAFTMVLSEGIILIPGLVYLRIKNIPLKVLVPFRKMKFSVWLLVIICTYLMYPLIIVLNAISLFFVKSGTGDLQYMITSQNFFLSTLLTAVLPAFAEEFIFRGIMFGSYRRSKMMGAIILSAFLFGLMHMNFNQFLYAFALGIYFSFLVEATGSILSSMLAHFTVNFTSVVTTYFLLPKLERFMEEWSGGYGLLSRLSIGSLPNGMDGETAVMLLMGIVVWGVIAVAALAGAWGIYVGICHITGRWEYVKGMFRRGNGQRLWSVSLVIAVALCVGMILWNAMW